MNFVNFKSSSLSFFIGFYSIFPFLFSSAYFFSHRPTDFVILSGQPVALAVSQGLSEECGLSTRGHYLELLC